MRKIILRKKIQRCTNKELEEFLLRVVKVSDSLKNNTLSKYVSDLSKSLKEFQGLRVNVSTRSYTTKIREIGNQADDVYRKLKVLVDCSAMCQAGQEQAMALKFQEIILSYGNITFAGITKKFADYEDLVLKLKGIANGSKLLKLDDKLTLLLQYITQYRNAVVSREDYVTSLKGKRKVARVKALQDYFILRDKVEALAEINGENDFSTFISQVNQALIRIFPNVSKKEKTE